jgi:hypothetical protein
MAYFCGGCLDGWTNERFMSGCSECKAMQGWGTQKVLEVWGPIVAWCRDSEDPRYEFAWVKNPNTYQHRIPYTGACVKQPTGQSKFWVQQGHLVNRYNVDRSEFNWNLLHPETQRNIFLRFDTI